jgi:signal transduction histidine kinase/ligand-binding sensor domain-containing protein/DNA-binding NarL/FixJ family response regulator
MRCDSYLFHFLALLTGSLFLLFPSLGTAQQSFKFYQLDRNENLLNSTVHEMVQDTLGFVWVATEDGLYRFDGSAFSAFRATAGRHSIPNNTVNALQVDQENRLWILTNAGIGLYDYLTDSIAHFLPQGDQVPAAQKVFTACAQGEDGAIYLATSGGGIFTYRKGQFDRLSAENAAGDFDLSQLSVSDLNMQRNVLWIATWEGRIYQLDLPSGRINEVSWGDSSGSEVAIHALFFDSQQCVWVGTSNGLQFVTSVRGKTPDNQLLDIQNKIQDEVLSILEDASSNLWVGTRNNGLYQICWRPECEGSVLRHFQPNTTATSVAHRTISHILQDRVGNIWLGTHSKGVNVFDPQGEKVTRILPSPGDLIAGKNVTSVWGIAPGKNGRIWLGTDGAGLFYYDLTQNTTQKYAGKEAAIRINDDAILCVRETEQNKLWIGTYAGGVSVIDLSTETVRHLSGLKSEDVRVIHQAGDGTIWIGTNRGGLHYYDEGADRMVSIAVTDQLDIRGIVDDPTNASNLWLATYGDGLIKYNTNDHALTVFNWNVAEKSTIPVAFTMVYQHNKIWLGTKESGLVSFDLKTETFATISEADGLINNSVHGLVPAGEHLWVSTNNGIAAYHVPTKTILNFDIFDGIAPGQFNDGSAFLFEDGHLVFGGIHGLNIFKPQALLERPHLPQLTFSDLYKNNEEVVPGQNKSMLSKGLPISEEVCFDPDVDNFTIAFKVLQFPNSLGWQYAYFLEGYDKEWNIHRSTNRATYRNVPPGTYTFAARVEDASTGQLGPTNQLIIRIKPPWWRTWPAYVAFTFLLAGMLWVLYRYNKERITMKQKLFYEQKLRQQEKSSMQEKIRFYTNFSHELRTPITLILGPINDLVRKGNIGPGQRNLLYLAKRNAHVLLKLVNRLLEFRKIETENTVLNVGYHDLSILAKEEAEGFTFLAKDSGIKFGFYCETNLHVWVDIEKIQIILNNLLSNALKYSEEGQKIMLKVYAKDEQIQVDVQDEGRGIQADEVDRIFTPFYQATNSIGTGGTGIGLALSKNLVELHDGKLWVVSEPGKGACFSMTLPLGRDHFEGKDHIRFVTNHQDVVVEDHLPEAGLQESTVDNERVMLVVDDHPDIREYVRSIFQDSFHVHTSPNGKDALAIAREKGPDIIISDLMMPEMDGLALCKALKKNAATSHIPIILLTAKSDTQVKIESFEEGADDHIAKPFDPDVLAARVNNLLQNRQQLRQMSEINQWQSDQNIPPHEVDFLRHVENVVLEALPEGGLKVPELARKLGFSRTSLYRKVKSLTGLSIKQLIIAIKLKKAAEMLATEDRNVSEVAFFLEFTDLKFFRSNFKKQFGMLPSEYQNKAQSRINIDQDAIRKQLDI